MTTTPVSVDGWRVVECDGVRWAVAPSYIWPVSIGQAAELAKAAGCELPTPKLVDAIWRECDVKIDAAQLTRTFMQWTMAEMSSKAVIESQAERIARLIGGRPYTLLGGMCKDVVRNEKGVIGLYGWHRLSGYPIQPFFSGHALSWIDYSQGLRYVRRLK